MTRALVVTDLGWGDAGKGTTVDFLARTTGLRLVVRWNGGSQAGHRVVTDEGREHVFAQLGAGTFVPGVRTHLAETVLVDPLALAVEARHLGLSDALERLSIAASARVITPFHVAANHLRELARGPEAHGTTGCGIGETVRDAIERPDDVVRAHHLRGGHAALQRRLGDAQDRLVASLDDELRALEGDARAAHARAMLLVLRARDSDAITERIAAGIGHARIVDDDAIDGELRAGGAVLEGAQGVLLDEDVGWLPPHVTWSRCTSHAAHAWLDAHGFDGARTTYGVMRTYATRHGAGPFPTEDSSLAPLLPEPAQHGAWQGVFRVGRLDLERLRYALRQSPVDALVVTHLDRLDVVHGQAPREPDAFVGFVEAALGRPVAIRSFGPRASDKRAAP